MPSHTTDVHVALALKSRWGVLIPCEIHRDLMVRWCDLAIRARRVVRYAARSCLMSRLLPLSGSRLGWFGCLVSRPPCLFCLAAARQPPLMWQESADKANCKSRLPLAPHNQLVGCGRVSRPLEKVVVFLIIQTESHLVQVALQSLLKTAYYSSNVNTMTCHHMSSCP